MTSIEVYINENSEGDGVAIMFVNAGFIEVEGELNSFVEVTPADALLLAEALVRFAGLIVKGT